MGKSLVIVESPAKAKTINKYLGKDFKVMASMGHVRDLPSNRLGVDLEHDFEPEYIAMPSKRKVLSALRAEAKKADAVYLAPDPDREGEAICWHLCNTVVPKNTRAYRVMFNEITKSAIQNAMSSPGKIEMDRVDAQQARRILDRLVGYMISPVLWKKVKRGISAGRVQSVALRMIVDREYEILAFNQEEYWAISVRLEGSRKPVFKAKLVKWRDQAVRQGNKATKFAIENEAQAKEIEEILKEGPFLLHSIQRKAKKQAPPVPFTTSKLQQDASRALGFSVKKTMVVAQKLYEGVEIGGEPVGLITYMRTDSTRVSEESLAEVRSYIEERFGPPYLPKEARRLKQKANVQDGHEAIRPTNIKYTPDSVKANLDRDAWRLYALIWKRFVASQMNPKLMDETVFNIQAGPGAFESRGVVTTFAGFSILNMENASKDDAKSEIGSDLPALQEGEALRVHELEKQQNLTKPPARYSEASLVKALEENGVGRPSTYAAIIATIQNRDYVEKREGRFFPSELGLVVINLLTGSFPDLMDVKYTARMENQLDEVEAGKKTWRNLLRDFFEGFHTNLKNAETHMPNIKREGIQTDLSCRKCGKPLVIKAGKYGQFLSCSNYPECTFASKIKDVDPQKTNMLVLKGMIGMEREVDQDIGMRCPDCGGKLVRKRGKYGEFTACSNYPDCRYIHKERVGVTCPKDGCGGDIHVKKSKRGKIFYCCTNYPKCDFVSWDKPTGEACPECKAATLYEKQRARQVTHYCAEKPCGYSQEAKPEVPATA